MLDFDDSRNWTSLLTAALADLVSEIFVETLVTAAPEFVEDAFDLLLAHTDRERVVDAAVGWIRSTTVAGYHGTRLIDADVDSIRDHGLVPLDANARRARLVRALSLHPQWNNVAHRLDSILREHGMGAKAGRREGQVHLTVSRSGLVNGFNHYLTHGSEFDQRVAQDLLGSEGKEILQRDGCARVLRLAVPGELALDATNRFFTVDERLSRGEVPNLVREFLTAWSYGLAHPDFDCATLKTRLRHGVLLDSASILGRRRRHAVQLTRSRSPRNCHFPSLDSPRRHLLAAFPISTLRQFKPFPYASIPAGADRGTCHSRPLHHG